MSALSDFIMFAGGGGGAASTIDVEAGEAIPANSFVGIRADGKMFPVIPYRREFLEFTQDYSAGMVQSMLHPEDAYLLEGDSTSCDLYVWNKIVGNFRTGYPTASCEDYYGYHLGVGYVGTTEIIVQMYSNSAASNYAYIRPFIRAATSYGVSPGTATLLYSDTIDTYRGQIHFLGQDGTYAYFWASITDTVAYCFKVDASKNITLAASYCSAPYSTYRFLWGDITENNFFFYAPGNSIRAYSFDTSDMTFTLLDSDTNAISDEDSADKYYTEGSVISDDGDDITIAVLGTDSDSSSVRAASYTYNRTSETFTYNGIGYGPLYNYGTGGTYSAATPGQLSTIPLTGGYFICIWQDSYYVFEKALFRVEADGTLHLCGTTRISLYSDSDNYVRSAISRKFDRSSKTECFLTFESDGSSKVEGTSDTFNYYWPISLCEFYGFCVDAVSEGATGTVHLEGVVPDSNFTDGFPNDWGTRSHMDVSTTELYISPTGLLTGPPEVPDSDRDADLAFIWEHMNGLVGVGIERSYRPFANVVGGQVVLAPLSSQLNKLKAG